MNTVIRAHIKNDLRLSTLERGIQSWVDKELYDIGTLTIVDDGSPDGWDEKVYELCEKINVGMYHRASGTPDTKNGLVESLKLEDGKSVLCCVDDMVFGQNMKEALNEFISIEEEIGKYGLMGFFACYGTDTRDENSVPELGGLWKVPIDILYALVCHVFSPGLSYLLINEWDGIKKGLIPDPGCCDDIWVKRICQRNHLAVYNSKSDYAFHTGISNRTFSEIAADPGSDYQTPCFVGE